MKKNIIAKIGAAAVVLTMVTTSLVGGTFAKYTSTVSGDVKASVAKWAVDFTKTGGFSTEEKTVYLVNLNDNANTANDKIAPGSFGQIDLTIDGSATEVDYTYEVKANIGKLNGVPIKFYSDADHKTVLDVSDSEVILDTGDVIFDSGNKKKEITIYWAWDDANVDDTALGEAATTGTITLTMTAEQLITSEAAPTE